MTSFSVFQRRQEGRSPAPPGSSHSAQEAER
jgi:hypothetical protein